MAQSILTMTGQDSRVAWRVEAGEQLLHHYQYPYNHFLAVIIFQFQLFERNVDTMAIICCCFLGSFHFGFLVFVLTIVFTTLGLLAIDVLQFIGQDLGKAVNFFLKYFQKYEKVLASANECVFNVSWRSLSLIELFGRILNSIHHRYNRHPEFDSWQKNQIFSPLIQCINNPIEISILDQGFELLNRRNITDLKD